MSALVLGPWGRVLVMAAGAASVLLALLVVVCLVGPGCCLHEYVQRDQDRRRRRQKLLQSCDLPVPAAGDPKLTAVIRPPMVVTPLPVQSAEPQPADVRSTNGSLVGRMQLHRDSTYSSMSEGTERSSSFRSVTTTDSNDSSGDPIESNVPQIKISLQYFSSEENGAGKLSICIKEAQSLPPRDYMGGLEPYISVAVLRLGWPLHRRAGQPLHTFRTNALRHSFNPKFDQTFTVDARRSEIKEWCLRVTAYDQDRFANPTELCSLELSLKEVKGLTSAQEEKILTFNLAPTAKDLGQILFGLSFLPTAQRLSFCIIKAANLKHLEVSDSLSKFYPFVRVIQLNTSTGRSIRRKKTSFRHGTENPEFNETLTFNVSPSQLEGATFLLLVCTRSLENTVSSEQNKICSQNTRVKDRCLGKVALSRSVYNKKNRDHWLSMLSSPRTVVSMWHNLK